MLKKMFNLSSSSLSFQECIYQSYSTSILENLNTGTFLVVTTLLRGPGSSVGIVTDYGVDGPEIESR
jgi:hypothetical protein